MTLTLAKWTIEEYHQMISAGIFDSRRVELLKGEIVDIFWLIEYSNSSLEKDLETKTKIYAEVGIIEYWVVNLQKRQLIVFREPSDGEYASKSTVTEGTIYPSAFPHIAVSVDMIISN